MHNSLKMPVRLRYDNMCFILNIIVLGFFLQVELLVMKALSLGLVKGFIDEIDQKVSLTWVQPRVLDLQQVSI
jgi:uncharacterized membrane protein